MKLLAPMFLALILGCATGAALAQNNLPGPSANAHLPGHGTVSPSSGASSAAAPSSLPQVAAVPDENYRLGTGDKMKITVYDEVDLSGEFLVDANGQVQFPLVGNVEAAGLSLHQFVTELTNALGAKYLKDPKVSVEIENYRPFYIMGEVNKPGEYPYENRLNVLGAVALAGGFTYRADDGTVYIRRKGDIKEKAQPASPDTMVAPGDVVRIPERIF